VALAYPLAEVSLATYVGKEAFITALNENKLQLEVMKREPQFAVGHSLPPTADFSLQLLGRH